MDEIEVRSITHLSQKDILSKDEVSDKVEEIRSSLIQKYGKNTVEYNQLNDILENLSDFEFGRFLIYNKSMSGYWTHYVIMEYKQKRLENKIEKFLLEKSPGTLATRERFKFFQKLLNESIKENSVCCSIPCGLMTEFITLDLDKKIKNLFFVGIDLDESVFDKAKTLAVEYDKFKYNFSFIKEDAWSIKIKEEFDILTSNGLNIYEKDDARVVALYKNFFNALKPGGIFIGSAIAASEERDVSKIDKENFEFQKKIYSAILGMSWSNPRSSEKSAFQLKAAGFHDIQFYWDMQRAFYTFRAKK